MVQIVPYNPQVRAAPLPAEKQRAATAGLESARRLGAEGQQLGGQMAQAAEAWDQRIALQDEATAMDLDAKFSDEAREIEQNLMAQQGENALNADGPAREQMTALRARYAGMARNGRQRDMVSRVLDRRLERFAGAADNHLLKQTEVYHDSAETGRLAALSRDAVAEPEGEARIGMFRAIRETTDARASRKGLDRAAADALFLDQISGVHQATIATLIEGPDPHAAKGYLERWGAQIDPSVRPEIEKAVRTQVDTFDAIQFFDRNPIPHGEAVVDVATPEGRTESVTFRAPVAGRLSSGFGRRASPGGVGSSNHRGQDVAVPPRTPVVATAPGVVRWRNDPDGYGRYAVIDHGNGYETRLAHLGAAVAREGARVEQGDVVGLSGGAPGTDGAGNSQGAHVHYEIRHNGAAVDPASVVGRQRAVAPGSGSAARSPAPATLEDVYDRADAAAGDDWRRREIFRREGVQRFSQERAMRNDRESEAERELQDYLPGGAKEVSDISRVPRDLQQRLSPGDLRAASNAFKAEAEGEGDIDRALSNDTFNALADEAAVNPQAFLARGELTQYRGTMTEGQINSLRGMRRQLVTGGPEASGALRGTATILNTYARSVGIETGQNRTTEDADRLAMLNGALARSVEGWMRSHPGQEPPQEVIQGMLRVLVAPTGEGRSMAPLFEGGGRTANIAVPNDARRRITAALAASNPPIRNPTDAQIRLAYRQAVFAGTERPPAINPVD